MSGYVGPYQYDTETVYHSSLRIVVGLGEGDTRLGGVSEEDKYKLSNNGQWYAGANYEVDKGNVNATLMSDNSAQSQWYYNYGVVQNSYFSADGTPAVSEETIHAKDGNTYIMDQDANGNNVDSAEFNTSTGKLISETNFTPKTIAVGDIYNASNNGYLPYYRPSQTPDNPNPNSVTAVERSSQTSSSPQGSTVKLPMDLDAIHNSIEKDFLAVSKLDPSFTANYDQTGTLRSSYTANLHDHLQPGVLLTEDRTHNVVHGFAHLV